MLGSLVFAINVDTIMCNSIKECFEGRFCMKALFEKYFGNTREALSYLCVGVVSSVVNLGSYFIFTESLGLNYLFANVVSWALTVLVGFVGNKLYVFRSPFLKGRAAFIEFSRFVSGRVFSMLVDMVLIWLMVSKFGVDSAVAKLVNSVIVVIINYFVSKKLVFKNTGDTA